MYTDAEGAWNLHARGPVEDGARFKVVYERLVNEMFKTAKAEGRKEPVPAYAFDALIALADRAGAPGSDSEPDAKAKTRKSTPARYLALIRVDHDALVRGEVAGDEECEIAGMGPIPVPVARDLLGDAILKLVITKGVDVANITHLGRSVTVAQQVALWWRSPTCTVLGCNRTQRIENDHNPDFAQTHHTRLDESDPLCEHDHDKKTRLGWALIPGKGKRAFVPPDDPRHPNNRRPPPEDAP